VREQYPHRRGRRRRSPFGLILAGVVLVAVVGGVIYALVHSSSSSGTSSSKVCDATSVADGVLPSVVKISANGASGAGTGSGEVIRSDGYILTNNHVISDAAHGGHVKVLFSDGTEVDATITGRDPQTDLAVLHVKPPFDLKVIVIGSSDTVSVGQPVVALGAPLGLAGTVTSGIVSALDRNIHVPGDAGGTALLVSAIQTDAAINPGNSGGALVNCDRQLVGVPTAGAVMPSGGGGNIGLGFAIPVDSAMQIANDLIEHGSVTHSYFGLATVPIPDSAAQQAGTPEGLFVQGLAPHGPASDAGLKVGDVITKIDGQAATSNIQLESLTLTKRPGDTVDVTYSRDGQSHDTTITLGASPD
jgi:putative serine protease PepD